MKYLYNYSVLILLCSTFSQGGNLPVCNESLLIDDSCNTISFEYLRLFNSARDLVFGSFVKISGNESVSPIFNRIETGYWSDKLSLVPYREYLSIGKQENWSRLAAQMLSESFNLAGKSAEETSQIITDAIKGGASVYGHLSFNPLELVRDRITAGVSSSVSFTCDLSEAPFLLLFSEKNGLRTGSDLPLTHSGVQICMNTDIETHYVQQINVNKTLLMLAKITSGIIDCDKVYVINGINLSLGNAMLDITAKNGGIHLNSDGSRLYADVTLRMRGSGISVRNDNILNVTRKKGFPVSGIGFGLNSGLLLNGDHTSLAFGVKKLGPMIWNKMKEAEISLKTANISVAELLQKNYQLFDTDNGGEVSGIDTGELMHDIPSSVCWLPLSVNAYYEYRFFLQSKRKTQWIIPEYVIPSISYNHNLTSWPGIVAGSGITIGCEAGFIKGIMPLSTGWSLGYGKRVASSLSAGLNVKKFNLQIGYEAAGTAYWYPKRGCGVYLQVVSGWGRGW